MFIVIIVVGLSISSAIFISFMTIISPSSRVLLISSDLGWYSLSVVLNTDFLGEYYGMITFLIDFLREILVIVIIPLLKRYLSVELVGYAANTAMDFCLPIIRNNYGNKVVPIAITIGLMLTIITPALYNIRKDNSLGIINIKSFEDYYLLRNLIRPLVKS